MRSSVTFQAYGKIAASCRTSRYFRLIWRRQESLPRHQHVTGPELVVDGGLSAHLRPTRAPTSYQRR